MPKTMDQDIAYAAEWQALLKAEEDHGKAKTMKGLEQARRGRLA